MPAELKTKLAKDCIDAVKTPTTEDVTGGIVGALDLLRRHPGVARAAIDVTVEERLPERARRAGERLLSALIEDFGPLLYHCDSEEQQRSFQSTCRKFHRFLKEPAR